MTEKLYDTDSYIKEFTAVVTACEAHKDFFYIVLDRTAFFPEGGGQAGDSGFLNTTEIFDTHETNGVIRHYGREAITPGTPVTGYIDWEKRFDRMQQHSGEHLVSGLVHQRFGYDNVGFHLGEQDVTLDFNGPVTKQELSEIELAVNRVIWNNLPVQISFPSKESLQALNYRSKIAIEGQVRIVTVPGIDICACCAPHVKHTGEIGLVKFTDMQVHRGGVRITMQAGSRALTDYREKAADIKAISVLLSSKEERVSQAVERLKQENYTLTGRLMQLQAAIVREKADSVPKGTKNIAFFEENLSPAAMQELVNLLTERCTGVVSVFVGNDRSGYRYVLGSASVDVQPFCRKLNEAFHGKGGGKPEMVQGALKGTQKDIRDILYHNP